MPFHQRLLYLAATLMLLSGIAHLPVWAWLGGDWEGAVSWRKPILFGVSTGLTAASLAWLVGKLRPRRGDPALLAATAAALLVEVALITLQQWRGAPAHFHADSWLDGWLVALIEWLVVYAAMVIVYLTARSFGELAAASDMRLAIRGGMVLLTIACCLGGVMVVHGRQQAAAGLPPETFGAAGVMKFPHGVPIHAIQVLPLWAWLLRRAGVAENDRRRAVAWAIAGVSGLTIFSLVQTFSGRGRFDLGPTGAVLLGFSLALLLGAARPLARRLLRRRPAAAGLPDHDLVRHASLRR